MKNIILDLFSGFGTATLPFEKDHNYAVLRYEINQDVIDHEMTPPTIKADLLEYPLQLFPRKNVLLVWVSTPCTEHSNAFNAPKPTAARSGEDFTPNMEFLKRAMEIVAWVRPKYVVYENVIGAIKDFEPFLGSPRQILGNVVLWGNFPYLGINPKDLKNNKTKLWGGDKMSHNLRSVIDPALSQALYDAITNQQTLF